MTDSVACAERDTLIDSTQECLLRLADLARHQAEALCNGSTNVVMAIDKQIEQTLGEKERSLGALLQHRQDHGC